MVRDVSIIIVNYYTSGQLLDCIRSIRRHTPDVSFEIIIVDNASEPELKEEYESEPDVRVVLLPENVGFGRANNAGFEVARGRYLFCLNPDTVLLNNAIGILVDFMDTHPEATACGANLYDAESHPTHSYRMLMPGLYWECNEFLNLLIEKKKYGVNRGFNSTGRPMEVAYVTGADLMLRRSAVEKTGGFDPQFFMYYEETDLCLRLRKAGGRIYSVPEARIMHLEGGSFDHSEGVSLARIERSEKGRRTYYRKNLNLPTRMLAGFIYLMTLLTRSILLPEGPRRQGWRHKLRLFFRLS